MLASLFAGYAHPFLLLGFLVGWRLIQDYVTSPFVMARGVELHPALVIFGVLAGGEIAGVPGMFLSIPVMAAAPVIWRRLHALRAAPVAVARRNTSERATS
jgi:predicted PurR-regulated permease PerM